MSVTEPVLAEDDPALLTAGLVADEERRQQGQATRARRVEFADDLLPGVGGDPMSLREGLRRGGFGTVAVLAGLNFFDELDRTAFFVLGPDIQRSLDLSDSAFGAVAGVSALVFTLAAVPLGVLGDRRRRLPLAAVSALVAGVFSGLTGAAQQIWQLVVVRLAIGTGQSAVLSLHNPLLADRYPLEARAAVLGAHNTASPLAKLIGPVLIGGIAAGVGGSAGWRWAFVVPAAGAIVLGLACVALREPTRGGGEQAAVNGAAHSGADELPIPVGAGVERLLKIRTLKFLLLGIGVLGTSIVGLPTFFNLLLRDDYGLSPLQRGVVGSLVNVGALIGIPLGAAIGQRRFRRDPPSALHFVGGATAAFGPLLLLALVMRPLPLLVLGIALANLVGALALVPIYSFIAAVVPFRLRGLGFAVVGLAVTLVGGLAGNIAIGAISDASGPRVALASVVPVTSVLAGALIAYGARFVRRDMSLVVEELREEQDERQRLAESDTDAPLLQVRNLDFSYGQVQVLFDVAIDVRQGEILALLGTNGAGKSTLLRAIAGLQIPDRGAVRFGGRSVTYLDAEARVGMGIVQVPGGKAVFPSLTVLENLLAGAHGFIWDRALVAERVDEVLALFPILRERLGQAAGTLSGGEQQQLALAKALLLRPKLLCIDELSLGLAPVVVQEILETVRSLKERGVTMIIVEQSVNVALSIADRAVFMEKGQVRFEGAAQDLLERGDLVRAVFLGGDGG